MKLVLFGPLPMTWNSRQSINGIPGEYSIVPGSDASRVLLFFHGGGYCSGSIMSHRRMVTEAGRAARARTLAVAYRLAPEHPFPAAYEDALKAWHFLRKGDVPASRIAIGGDSAGAGLAGGVVAPPRGGPGGLSPGAGGVLPRAGLNPFWGREKTPPELQSQPK